MKSGVIDISLMYILGEFCYTQQWGDFDFLFPTYSMMSEVTSGKCKYHSRWLTLYDATMLRVQLRHSHEVLPGVQYCQFICHSFTVLVVLSAV